MYNYGWHITFVAQRQLGATFITALIYYDCMTSKVTKQEMKVVFVAKLSALAEDKFHLIIPKQYNSKVKSLKGKQVRVVVDDEWQQV